MDLPCLQVGEYLLAVDDKMFINAYDTIGGRVATLPLNVIDIISNKGTSESVAYIKEFFPGKKRDRDNFLLRDPPGKRVCQ